MAQQARPNVNGHIDCLRAHRTALSMVDSRMPRRTSSSSSSWPAWPRPVWGPSSRSPGTGHLPGLVVEGGRRRRGGSAPRRRLPPVQPAALPHVDVGHEHERDEDGHLGQAEQAELTEAHGPGEQEDGLDVEDDEQHRDDVELHGEPFTRGEPRRLDPALVWRQLGPRRAMRPKECGDAERDRKSTRLNSSHVEISYAVFCLKKKKQK